MRDTYILVKHKNTRAVFDADATMLDDRSMNNIARIRKARGLRQNDLADMVGVKQPHISRIESGDEGPPLALFRQIADALQVPLTALFSDTRADAEQIIIEAFQSLPEARRAGWIEMARMIQSESKAVDQAADRGQHQTNS